MSWASWLEGKLTGGLIGDKPSLGFSPPSTLPSSSLPSPSFPSSSPVRPMPSSGYNLIDPFSPPPNDGSNGQGNWLWDAAKGVWNFVKGNAGDILKTGASVAEGIMSSEDRAKQLAENARQYNENLAQRKAEAAQAAEQYGRTTGDTEAQAAVRAETQLNKSPIADKAQALILARMGVSPGVFQPRDFTKGLNTLNAPQAAPGANVATTLQNAATHYQPGQGGVDTATLRAVLNKFRQSSGLPTPASPTGPAAPTPPTTPPPDATPQALPTLTPLTPTPPPVPTGSSNPTKANSDPLDTDPKTDPASALLRRMVYAT